MKTNRRLHTAVMQVVDNQIRHRDPPETKEALDRLLADGHSKDEARRLIGCVVVSEIFDIMTKSEPFDGERFVKALARLPAVP